MRKRIRKKRSKRLDELIQEINIIGVLMDRISPKGPFFKNSSLPDIDIKAIKRVKKSFGKKVSGKRL